MITYKERLEGIVGRHKDETESSRRHLTVLNKYLILGENLFGIADEKERRDMTPLMGVIKEEIGIYNQFFAVKRALFASSLEQLSHYKEGLEYRAKALKKSREELAYEDEVFLEESRQTRFHGLVEKLRKLFFKSNETRQKLRKNKGLIKIARMNEFHQLGDYNAFVKSGCPEDVAYLYVNSTDGIKSCHIIDIIANRHGIPGTGHFMESFMNDFEDY
ncbi:hypothetical protein J4217_05035 [Candidatus Pacearchaeota archaeon]|nr:hypothetical protein [Candidatus Pacearchaeota archaeon]